MPYLGAFYKRTSSRLVRTNRVFVKLEQRTLGYRDSENAGGTPIENSLPTKRIWSNG